MFKLRDMVMEGRVSLVRCSGRIRNGLRFVMFKDLSRVFFFSIINF